MTLIEIKSAKNKTDDGAPAAKAPPKPGGLSPIRAIVTGFLRNILVACVCMVAGSFCIALITALIIALLYDPSELKTFRRSSPETPQTQLDALSARLSKLETRQVKTDADLDQQIGQIAEILAGLKKPEAPFKNEEIKATINQLNYRLDLQAKILVKLIQEKENQPARHEREIIDEPGAPRAEPTATEPPGFPQKIIAR